MDSDCPTSNLHTPAPAGYVERAEWHEEMAKTHTQKRCPGCKLWKVWEPK